MMTKPGILKFLAVVACLMTLMLMTASGVRAETYTKSFTYDVNGNVETRTTADNATITYSYNELNKLTDILYPDTKKVSYTYDENGNRTSMTDPNGTTLYAYDRFNRLGVVWYPGIAPIYYGYDKAGNLAGIEYPDGSIVAYVYDTSNRLWKVIDPNGTTTYEYDTNTNNLAKKTLPNGVSTSYAYDAAKRITDVVNKRSDNSVISSHHYEFDANGNRTQAVEVTPAGNRTTDYTYDKLNRLTNATCSDGTFETYTYDSSGNRRTKTTQNANITYEYDQDNRLVKITNGTSNTVLFYDRSGNLIKKISPNKTVTYGYDYENRLISYTDGANNVTFAYDGGGNRISKTVNGVTTRYINDTRSALSQVLLETDGQYRITARYSYGDSRLSQLNHGVTSYYVYDNPGRSVVAVVNGSQTVLNSYAYNSFGDIKTSNETTTNDFLYVGEQYDDETGLIYLRARYYDPEIGRFLSKDPFPGYVTQPQTVNPYPYVGNNPVRFIDPLGLQMQINFQEGTGTDTYGATVTVIDTSNNTTVFTGQGSTLPNNSTTQNTVAAGTYAGTNTTRASGGPGIYIGDTPTAAGSPRTSAQDIFVHCGFTETNRGSAGCLTISPNQCGAFFGNFGREENVNVNVRR